MTSNPSSTPHQPTPHSRLEEIISLGTAVIYVCKATDDYAATYISENVTAQLGYQPADFLHNPSFWADNIHPDDREQVFAGLPKLFAEGRHIHQYRFLHKDGNYRWMRDELRLVSAADGSPLEIIGSWTDITDSKKLEYQLREAQAHLAEAQKIAHLGSWTWNCQSGEILWSDEVYRIFDLSKQAVTPTYEFFLQCVHPDDRATVEQAVENALSQSTAYEIEHRLVRQDGSVCYVLEQAEVKLDNLGNVVGLTGTILDITERKQIELALQEKKAHLKHLAHYDALTDLPNRLLLQDRLEQALGRARRKNRLLGVLFIDIDNFKKVNDTCGHRAGDNLLKDIAARLKAVTREADTLARLSGDEFVVVIEEPPGIDHMANIAQKLLDTFEKPFSTLNRQFFLTASIGISVYPDNADHAEGLLARADVSMYAAKHGRNTYQFYSPELDAHAHERLLLENDLRRAIERNQLILHYQPLVDLNTGQLIGMEALLRWQHPKQGMIPPNDFIPVAENTGLILPIGNWILKTACQQARDFQAAGIQPFRMCVNISMHQFKKPDFPELVIHTLEETGLDAELLELEVTESIAMENAEETISHLSILRELGVRVAIDDFGTGHSSLSHLKHLPITTLKIDRGFVAEVLTDQYDFVIIEAIQALAKSLNLEVVAEGIETEEQKHILNRLRCHVGQGYLFCRPLPQDELVSILKSGDYAPWCPMFKSGK